MARTIGPRCQALPGLGEQQFAFVGGGGRKRLGAQGSGVGAQGLACRRPDLVAPTPAAAIHGTARPTLSADGDPNSPAAPHRAGLATFARFAVAEQRFEPHPSTDDMRWDERKGGKGFMASLLETPIGAVHVVNLFELEVTAGHVLLRGADALSDHFGVFSELTMSRVDAGRTSRLEAG